MDDFLLDVSSLSQPIMSNCSSRRHCSVCASLYVLHPRSFLYRGRGDGVFHLVLSAFYGTTCGASRPTWHVVYRDVQDAVSRWDVRTGAHRRMAFDGSPPFLGGRCVTLSTLVRSHFTSPSNLPHLRSLCVVVRLPREADGVHFTASRCVCVPTATLVRRAALGATPMLSCGRTEGVVEEAVAASTQAVSNMLRWDKTGVNNWCSG